MRASEEGTKSQGGRSQSSTEAIIVNERNSWAHMEKNIYYLPNIRELQKPTIKPSKDHCYCIAATVQVRSGGVWPQRVRADSLTTSASGLYPPPVWPLPALYVTISLLQFICCFLSYHRCTRGYLRELRLGPLKGLFCVKKRWQRWKK